MRGTGYAIGEILIFLVIAAIIGFLLGWVVFYRRRPDTTNATTPRAVEAVEARTKSLQSKLDYVEKRTNAVLGAIERSPAVKERKKEAAAKQTAPAPAEDKKPEPVAGKKPEPAAEKIPATSAAKNAESATDTKPDEAKTAEPATDTKPHEAKRPEPAKPLEPTGDENLDTYLTKADERIHQLEDTLDRLSEKLAELEE